VKKDPGATGGHFSISYIVVHKDGTKAFMKALNFNSVVGGQGDVVDRLHSFTEAFKFERDLLTDCRERRMSRVIKMIDSGVVTVPDAGPLLSQVPYLIFELAEGDIRSHQAATGSFDCAWAFRVMKHTFLGVSQLHSAHTTHQDLKPSNVLTLENGREMKLGDLGNADRRGIDGPCTGNSIPGALAYAPPEQQYGAFGRTWPERQAADLYLAGSLAVQLFLGHCHSVLLQDGISQEFSCRSWGGPYGDVLPYLVNAHNTLMRDLFSVVFGHFPDQKSVHQFVQAVAQLTDPDPPKRGNPKDRIGHANPFSLQRYVSLMELLSKRAHHRLIGRGR